MRLQTARLAAFAAALFSATALRAQVPVTQIYTNYGGFWTSTSAANTTKPDNSHLLLGFTYNGVTYSTGVADGVLQSNGVSFQPKTYRAFELANSISGNASTKIGVGYQYGGAGNVTPVPVTNNMSQYLTDGSNGLDLGTAIFNLPSSKATYSVSNMSAASIGDNVPDIIVTQVGQPPASTELDSFMFVDGAGQVVGRAVAVSLSSVQVVGTCSWKFYNPVSSPTYDAGLAGDRPLRLLGLDLSCFNLNASNIGSISGFVHKLSGASDQAFIAYSAPSFQAAMGQVLPITLTGFEAGRQGKTVELNWNASMPQDFSHFEVEAGRGGAGRFEKIGEVSFREGARAYAFTDASPVAGANYYRLKMVDEDGSATYSPVRTVRFTESGSMSLAPNPANGFVSIAGVPEGSVLQVSDMSGKVLLETAATAGATRLDVSGLVPGTYLVSTAAGSAMRFIKN